MHQKRDLFNVLQMSQPIVESLLLKIAKLQTAQGLEAAE